MMPGRAGFHGRPSLLRYALEFFGGKRPAQEVIHDGRIDQVDAGRCLTAIRGIMRVLFRAVSSASNLAVSSLLLDQRP